MTQTTPTGEHCQACGYEFVIFPDGTDERDLAATISVMDDTKPVCIDCAEAAEKEHSDDSCDRPSSPSQG